MTEKDNWYLVLELPFDPKPESDPAMIEARIVEKVQFWSKNVNDPLKGDTYRLWRESADTMRADLADSMKREQLAQEAREITFGRLDRLLQTASNQGKKTIAPKVLHRIACTCGYSDAAASARAKAIGLEVSEATVVDPGALKATYDAIYNAKPDQFTRFDAMKVELEVADCADLYEFAHTATPFLEHEAVPNLKPSVVKGLVASVAGTPDPRLLPSETLRKAGEYLRRSYFRKKTATGENWTTLGKSCETVFVDDATRRAYDRYLDFIALRSTIDDTVEELATVHENRCGPATARGYIDRFEGLVGDRAKATAFFEALCSVHGVACELPADEDTSGRQTMICRCQMVNDITDGRTVCAKCGRPLMQTCPKCGKQSSNVNSFCACGYDFQNILRAGMALRLAREALARFELPEAKAQLAEARRLDPSHSGLAEVDSAITREEKAIGSQLAVIEQCVREQRFEQASGLLDALQTTYPRFENPRLVQFVSTQLVLARNKLDQARRLTDPSAILKACKEIYSVCRDLSGLTDLVSHHTSLPLEALSVNEALAQHVKVSVVNQWVSVRLDVPDEGEQAIVVLYRFDQAPISPDDHQAIRKEFQTVQLRNEGLLRLENAQDKHYHVAVFLRFEANGTSFYSAGVHTDLDLASKTVLTYSMSKRPFSSKVTLRLQADHPSGTLPEIALVWAQGHVPVFESSSQHLMTIPPQAVDFPYTITFEAALPKNSYIKPFYHEESVQLKLATNASNKIT